MNILDSTKKRRGTAVIAVICTVCLLCSCLVGCTDGEGRETEAPDSSLTDTTADTTVTTDGLKSVEYTFDTAYTDWSFWDASSRVTRVSLMIPDYMQNTQGLASCKDYTYENGGVQVRGFEFGNAFVLSEAVDMDERICEKLSGVASTDFSDRTARVGKTATGYDYVIYEGSSEGVYMYFAFVAADSRTVVTFTSVERNGSSELLKNSLDTFKTVEVNTVSDIDDLPRLGLSEEDNRDDYIKAFVTLDTARLEELSELESGTYDSLKDLEITSWCAWTEPDGSDIGNLRFCYTATDYSSMPGPTRPSHSYTVEEGMNGVALSDVNLTHNLDGAEGALHELVGAYGIVDIPTTDEMDDGTRWAITCYITRKIALTEGVSLEEMQAYAEKKFGIEGFTPDATHMIDGKYCEVGHGVSECKYKVLNVFYSDESNCSITAQLYLDYSCLVPAQVYLFVMEYTDGEWVFRGSDIAVRNE